MRSRARTMFIVLRPQLMGDFVERLAELSEVAFRSLHRDLHTEIAGRHEIGGADQAPDRRYQADWRSLNPIQTADSSTVSAITVYMSAKAICTPSRRASSAAYSLTLV